MATKEQRNNVCFKVDAKTYKKLKYHLLDVNMTMQDCMEAMLHEYLNSHTETKE